MAERQYSAKTFADMIAAFLYQTLPPIDKKTTLHMHLQTLKLLCKYSQKIKSGLGPLGHLFAALPQQHYQWFTGAPLILPGPTPKFPTYPNWTNASQQENAKLKWQAHQAKNDNICNMNEVLILLFLTTIQPVYKNHLENNLAGVKQHFFKIYLRHFLTNMDVSYLLTAKLTLQEWKNNGTHQKP